MRLTQPMAPPLETPTQDSKCSAYQLDPILHLWRSYARSTWCSVLSTGSPPTAIRQRHVIKFPRSQNEDSFFACSWMRPWTPVMACLIDATTAHVFGKYEGSTSVEDHKVVFVNHSWYCQRTFAPWDAFRLEMSPSLCRCEFPRSNLPECQSFHLQDPRINTSPTLWIHHWLHSTRVNCDFWSANTEGNTREVVMRTQNSQTTRWINDKNASWIKYLDTIQQEIDES